MDETIHDTAISVSGVGKTFRLPHERQSSIKGLFVNLLRRKKTYEIQRVLHDITFEVKKGEFFGIVGRNGSGKSTLLKMLAGIYHTDKGIIKINGKLTPFIELGVGFNPELTGRENVYLNGALLGITRKEMNQIYDEIVAFAELEKFMDQKLKNYSSGMQVRLAFSIAIRAKGDILLLDEVLAVGDAAFQKKCLDYFVELKRNEQTVVLVTHDMSSVERFCDRAMLIESGEIHVMGKSTDVAREYEEMFIKDDLKKRQKEALQDDIYRLDTIQVKKAWIEQNGKKSEKLQAFTNFTINFLLKSKADIKNGFIGMYIKNYEGRVVIATDTLKKLGGISFKKGQEVVVSFEIENILTNGMYTVNIAGGLDDGEARTQLLQKRPIVTFMVSGVEKYRDSLIHPEIKISLGNK